MEARKILLGTGLTGLLLYLLIFIIRPTARPHMYYEILFGFLLLACIGYYWERETLWKWVGICFLFGILWEVVTEANFIYANNLAPMLYIYKDVPLAVCFWWVANFMIASDVAKRLAKKYHELIAAFIAVLLIMLPFESIGHNLLKMWTYAEPSFVNIPPYWLPWQVVLGWLFFGALFLTTIHKYATKALKQK